MHIASVNVRFYETDMMGIAHHSNHFRWFEMARIEFLRKIGVTLWDMMNEDIVFPIMYLAIIKNLRISMMNFTSKRIWLR